MTDSSQKPPFPNYTPDVGRLVTDRFDFQQHVDGSAFNHVAGSITLSPPLTITAHGTFTDVQDILATLATLVSAPIVPDATTGATGLIQLSGDLSGTGTTATSPKVSGLQGLPVNTVPPTTSQVLTWNGASWGAADPPASSGSTGGDLSGTYQSPYPTVIRINGANVPTLSIGLAPPDGYILQASAIPSTLKYAPVTMAGDVTGDNTATTVIQLQGNPIQSGVLGVTQDGYVLTWINGSTQWQAQPSARNLARGWTTNAGMVGPVVATVIVCSTIITPAVTGKIRVTVTGYVSHITQPNLSGTFNVSNGSASVTASVSQTGALSGGDIITFASQPYVRYVVSTVVGTSITLTTNYLGTSNATTTAFINEYHAVGIYITQGVSLVDPGVIAQFLGTAETSTGNDGDVLCTVSYAYDYDKLSTPTIFPLGVPVTFNVIMKDLTGNEFQVNANGIQLEVQEVF